MLFAFSPPTFVGFPSLPNQDGPITQQVRWLRPTHPPMCPRPAGGSGPETMRRTRRRRKSRRRGRQRRLCSGTRVTAVWGPRAGQASWKRPPLPRRWYHMMAWCGGCTCRRCPNQLARVIAVIRSRWGEAHFFGASRWWFHRCFWVISVLVRN